jgi:L-alanine-DL-glutamate epimerase-like enolase superfamily enzyme
MMSTYINTMVAAGLAVVRMVEPGLPLKTLYAAHLAAGLGNIPIVEGVPGHTEGAEDYTLEDGYITLSEQPGFGIKLP